MTIAAVDRGLTVDAVKDMTIGDVVDYVVEYNELHDPEKEDAPKKQGKREATQADWDAFLG